MSCYQASRSKSPRLLLLLRRLALFDSMTFRTCSGGLGVIQGVSWESSRGVLRILSSKFEFTVSGGGGATRLQRRKFTARSREGTIKNRMEKIS